MEVGDHVLAVLGRGGEVSADGVAVLGAVFAGEAPGEALLRRREADEIIRCAVSIRVRGRVR